MKIKAILIINLILLCSISMAYTDITEDYWAKEIIEKFTQKGLVKGYPDGSFRPETSLTRAEFVTMLVNTLGLKEVSNSKPYVISDEHWAKSYIDIAQGNGIIEAGDYSSFNPDVSIRRYEICKMIANSFDNIKEDYKNNYYRSEFSDIKEESKEINSIIAILKEIKLLAGYPDNTIRINNTCERAEAIAFLNNILENTDFINKYDGINKNIIYYDGDKIVGKSDLPSKLIKREFVKGGDSPIIINIDSIEFFKYDERGNINKELFDKIKNATTNEFCKNKQFSLNDNYLMKLNLHINNTSKYAVDIGADMLNIDFIEDDVEIIDEFTEEKIVDAIAERLSYEEVLGGESELLSIFYIINNLPIGNIRFSRKDTTLTDYEKQTFVHINYDTSLVIDLKR